MTDDLEPAPKWPNVPHVPYEPDEVYPGAYMLRVVDAQEALIRAAPVGMHIHPVAARYIVGLWHWSVMWGWS